MHEVPPFGGGGGGGGAFVAFALRRCRPVFCFFLGVLSSNPIERGSEQEPASEAR
jgi:hypothetical protein